jgi:dTDP-4-dehydrorhamnose reductase
MILITGGNGQLGTELRHLLDERGVKYFAADVNELDITDKAAVDAFFDENKPELVYHCAAYTAVDKAEDEGKALNEKINVDGTRNVANAAARVDATLVYISTDYVFNGDLPVGQEWEVDAPIDPQSEYGRTKRLGEVAVEESGVKFYIVRTAWVFGNYGHNFVFTMQNLAKTHETLTVVNDQHGRPTWTRTLAEFLVYLVDNNVNLGYYHLTNDAAPEEDVTWFDFATEILKDTDTKVTPVDSSAFAAKAKRPFNSTMSLKKTKATGFVVPTWQEALALMIGKGDLRPDKTGVKGDINKK